ncbi:MAG TPA: zf-TFIIB domain-containing protein [Gemmatimonadales bacterium]|nr:zf-TFIIB domain-containing protein [Gemmatimonadales bacterium]
MECPKCQARMNAVQFEEVEVDRCVRCGGIWFDLLEHEELKGRAGSEAIDTGPTWQAAMHNVQRKVFCPLDGTLMVRMVDTAQPQIWVESCPVCHGTFFDAGEFTDFKDHTIGELLRSQRRQRAP